MKFYTSYFYQIRNFTPNLVPVSVCISDPFWFHDSKDANYVFIDKRGILNGIRLKELVPRLSGVPCGRDCLHYKRLPKDEKCDFLIKLREYYNTISFKDILNKSTQIAINAMALASLSDIPSIVFTFYEAPDNPCSERKTFQEWFTDNGGQIEELKYPIQKYYL